MGWGLSVGGWGVRGVSFASHRCSFRWKAERQPWNALLGNPYKRTDGKPRKVVSVHLASCDRLREGTTRAEDAQETPTQRHISPSILVYGEYKPYPDQSTEMCSGSEAGSYLRLIDFLYHSTIGLRVINKKKISLPA